MNAIPENLPHRLDDAAANDSSAPLTLVKLPPVTVAALQMCSGNELAANLETAERLLKEAAEGAGARVAVLPENFSMMAKVDAERRAIAEEDGSGPIQEFLARMAADLKMWIVAGTTPIKLQHEIRHGTACLVYNDQGTRIARYDKMHLFDVDLPVKSESYRESSYFVPGRRPVVVDTPAGKLGLSICYDMRFPELYRAMAAVGAEWFTMPSAFTVPTGQAHWGVLLRARAIENLCYVVAAGQVGTHPNGRDTYGHSMIVDHWGRILASKRVGEGIIYADIDLEVQRDTRRNFPALSHRVL